MPAIIDMPVTKPFVKASFALKHNVAMRAMRSLSQEAVQIADPLWVGEFTTYPLQSDTAGKWEAFIERLRGGLRLFRMYHPVKLYPRLYKDTQFAGLTVGGVQWDGRGIIDAYSADLVTIINVPDNFKLRRGDLVCWTVDGRVRLHVITNDVTSSGSVIQDVRVEPQITYTIPDNTEARFDKPYCNAIIDTNSVESSWRVGDLMTLKFRGIQVL